MVKSKQLTFSLILRIIFVVLGVMSIGMGAYLTVCSKLGSDALNVLGAGIMTFLPVQVGTMNALVNFGALVIVFFIGRSQIKVNTILSMFVVGTTMNFWDFVVGGFMSSADFNFAAKIVLVVLGANFIGLGVATVQKVDLGMAPNDLLPFVLYQKLSTKIKISYRLTRILYDATQVIIGVILGGLFGIGTIITACLVGPCIQFYLPHVSKGLDKIIK